MKLLFDQNLSHRLAAQLTAKFPGSAHVRDVGCAAAPDPEVWAYAATKGFMIVSKDTYLLITTDTGDKPCGSLTLSKLNLKNAEQALDRTSSV